MGFKAIYSIPALTLICLLVPPLALSQTSTIEVQHQDQVQSLQVPTLRFKDVDYVDFPKLVERMGGACTVLPKRMRIDLEGTTAWVGLNDNRVNALSIFSLSHKIISNEEGIYIALNDCDPFFRKAFRLTVSYTTPTRPDESSEGEGRPSEDLSGIAGTPSLNFPGQAASPRSYRVIRTVLLDPGHGGYEPGVEGATGIAEKDITLSISHKLETLLRNTNRLLIVHTREQDTSLSPQQRNAISQNTQADLLVSIHVGGAFSEETQGIAVFYPEPNAPGQGVPRGRTLRAVDYSEESMEIAAIIGQSLIRETRATFRGIHPIPNTLFNNSRRPSILIEVGCLTNQQEEALLSDELYQAKIAIGIANGIERLLDRANEVPPTPTFNNESIAAGVTPL